MNERNVVNNKCYKEIITEEDSDWPMGLGGCSMIKAGLCRVITFHPRWEKW